MGLSKQPSNARDSGGGGEGLSGRFVVGLLVLSNVFLFQLGGTIRALNLQTSFAASTTSSSSSSPPPSSATTTTTTETTNTTTTAPMSYDTNLLMKVPDGPAQALPSIRISEEEEKQINRKIYGGAGDKEHLGGFTEIDPHGISPSVWKFMVEYFGIKSILDVGCGRGISTSWFVTHGLETYCVEGSHDAVEKSIVPNKDEIVVEHDFSRGPWWPPTTVDAVWCVEFTEHVGRNFQHNYLTAFKKAAFIFVTHSNWGGWHHVEVHRDEWWRTRMESMGFVYSDEMTKLVKQQAREESVRKEVIEGIRKKGESKPTTYNAQHVLLTMQVFINPAVASLPKHARLMTEYGCFLYHDRDKSVDLKEECGYGKQKGVSKVPEEYRALQLTPEMDKAWDDLLKENIRADK